MALDVAEGRLGFFTAQGTVYNPTGAPLSGWTVSGSFAEPALLYGAKNAKLSQKTGLKAFVATPVKASITVPAAGYATFTFSGYRGLRPVAVTGLTLTAPVRAP